MNVSLNAAIMTTPDAAMSWYPEKAVRHWNGPLKPLDKMQQNMNFAMATTGFRPPPPTQPLLLLENPFLTNRLQVSSCPNKPENNENNIDWEEERYTVTSNT